MLHVLDPVDEQTVVGGACLIEIPRTVAPPALVDRGAAVEAQEGVGHRVVLAGAGTRRGLFAEAVGVGAESDAPHIARGPGRTRRLPFSDELVGRVGVRRHDTAQRLNALAARVITPAVTGDHTRVATRLENLERARPGAHTEVIGF